MSPVARLAAALAGLCLAVGASAPALAQEGAPPGTGARFGCASTRVVCLSGEDGAPLQDELPKALAVGEVVTIKVIARSEQTFVVRTRAFASPNTLFAPHPPAIAAMATEWKLRAAQDVQPAETDREIVVSVLTVDAEGHEARVGDSLVLPVEQGRFFVRPGLLYAFVPGAQRRVSGISDVSEGMEQVAAIALDIWPLGHRGGTLSPFDGPWSVRSVTDAVSLQVATDIDLQRPFDSLFVGVALEPVSGVAFSAGYSLLQVDYLPDRASVVDGAVATVPEARYRGGYYLGITLTIEVVDTLRKTVDHL